MSINLPTDQKKLATFVDRRHPEYADHVDHWCFCEDTYEGGRDWFKENIHKYLKEGTQEFKDRLERSYRFNHAREVVQLVTKYIFKQGVVRNLEDAPESLVKFWSQATLDGSSIDVLMRRVSDWTSINGRVWVVIDSKATTNTLTKADEKNGVTRIYSYIVKQEDLLDFSRDEWGRLNWILYRIPFRDDDDPINSSGAVHARYMLWTREDWVLLQDNNLSGDKRKIIEIARGPNSIGEVPVVDIDHMENEETYDPPGLIDDIAYLDRSVANYLSNLDAIIQDQTFSQLAMPSQGLLPGEDDYKKLLEMGTKRIFVYDGDSNKGPEYLVPDAKQAELIVSVIKMIIGEIYHSIGMAGERTKQDNAMGIDNSSGVAKAYDFDRMNALLASKADMLERAENRISYLVRRFSGNLEQAPVAIPAEDKDVELLIKYPDSYDVRGLPDEFDIASNLTLLEAPHTLRRQQMTIMVDKIFPRLKKDIKSKIISELKDWPLSETDKINQSLSTVEKLGSVVGHVKAKVNAANSTTSGSGKPAPKPKSNSKQGQNTGKSN